MVREVVLAEVEEGVLAVERVLELVGLIGFNLLIRGDAASAIDGTARSR